MRSVLMLSLSLCLTACSERSKIPAVTLGDAAEEEQIALEHLRERADEGDVHSAYLLVFAGSWQDRAYDEAIPELAELADRGSAAAARLLAIAYRDGRGVQPNYDEAARWLERAAELGDATATQEVAAYAEFKSSTTGAE